MKKIITIGLFLIAILAFVVSAALNIDRASIDKTVKPTGGFSEQFTITNNETTNITGLNIQLVTSELTRFNISTSPYSLNQQFALNAGSNVLFTVTGTVPDDITTRSAPYTGSLKAYLGSTQLGSIDLKIIAKSQLDFDNVKFIVDSSSKSIDDGDTRKDVLPGSKLEIKGDVRNFFTNSDDITIEDVTVTVTISNIDDGDDLEEEDEVGDVDADEKESFKVTFDIPEDVDADDYNVKMLAEGEDENGAKHSVEWNNIKLKIEKDKDDIQIIKLSVSPSKVSCSRNINVNVGLKNQGTKDEDEVVLRIENADLEISEEDTSIPEIDEGTGDDTEYSKTYSFKISDKVRAGTYPIKVTVYYDTDEQSDVDTVDLVVENCVVETPAEQKPSEVVVVSPPPSKETEETPEIITTPVTETTETSLLKSNTYLMLLIGAVGVAVIVIIIMIAVLFSMRKKE